MSEYQEEITDNEVSPHQEAAIRDAFDLPDNDEQESAPDESPEPEEKPEPTPDPEESSAKQHGWTTKAEWVAQGKNPDDWVNAKHFNEKGRLINQARKLETLEKSFDERVSNVHKLVKAQAEMQLKQLKDENTKLNQMFDEHGRYGDVEKQREVLAALQDNSLAQYSIKSQLDSSNQPANAPAVPQEDAEKEAAWERENQWINTQDPAAPEFGKAVFTKNLYAQLLNQYPNSTADERIQAVNQAIAQKFPPPPKTNPNRDKAPVTDAKSARSTSSELTWGELRPDELSYWEKAGHSQWPDKKAYLKAVKDSRRG